jgi:hypothetical protein
MKYSLIKSQPASNASRHAFKICASSRFLLMTFRSRCVPASGAIVNPDFRTRRTWRARSSVIVDACIDDRETETDSGSKRSIRSNSSGCTAPYSPVLSDASENWS